MGLTWYILGLLSTGSVILIWKLSRRYHMNPIGWSVPATGIILVLFSIAWSVGAVLEGVPRAASMGMLLFGLPGIAALTIGMRYVTTKLSLKVPDEIATTAIPLKEEFFQKKSETVKTKAKKTGRMSGVIGYMAYVSLFAAFVFGLYSDGKDYEGLLRLKMPDEKLVKVNDSPVVFQIDDKVEGKSQYVLIQEGQGYGGPFVIGIRINDDAKVHEVFPLENKETPAFAERVNKARYADQFIGKPVTDNFLVGDDIDAVTGATITTRAATEAIRSGAHTAAVDYFKFKKSWDKVPWAFGLKEILVIILFALAFSPTIVNKTPWKYLYMGSVIGIIGFYLNASISIGSLAALLLGYIPGIQEHIIWWVLVIGTVLTIFITGKNIYCYRICPFYGIQFLLSKISGSRLNPSPAILKSARLTANTLLWASLMTIFLSRHPGIGSYEPFAMMFSLEGLGIQWYLLPVALIGSFFMSTFWCRFFCPCGRFLNRLVTIRKNIVTFFVRDKQVKETT